MSAKTSLDGIIRRLCERALCTYERRTLTDKFYDFFAHHYQNKCRSLIVDPLYIVSPVMSKENVLKCELF